MSQHNIAVGSGTFTNRSVADEWLSLNAQIGHQANLWSRRRDIMAYIGPKGGQGIAPAMFHLKTHEVEINTDMAFGEDIEPSAIGDFTLRETHLQWPKATGYILHEAMHAAHSTATMEAVTKDMTPSEAEAYWQLEESRIEGRGVKMYPDNRVFFRACAVSVIANEDTVLKSKHPIEAAFWILAVNIARIDVGVLEPEDVKNIRKVVNKVVPKDIRKKLRRIWRQFQQYEDYYHLDEMKDLAREWDAILQKFLGENPRVKSEEEKLQELLDELLKGLMEDAIASTIAAHGEAQEQIISERAGREQRKRNEASREKADNERIAEEIFSKPERPHKDDTRIEDSGFHYTSGKTSSKIVSIRKPTMEERAAANAISQALKRAKYRDRLKTVVRSATPPGRLKVSAAMQGSAVRRMGGKDNSRPWRDVQRKHIEDPSLSLGIMCDISGSMGDTMEAMASAVWIMASAAHRIQGKTAGVYYGYEAFPVLKPNQRQTNVVEYSAPDGSEDFHMAFGALDGGLNLLQGRGARMIVVCSDGEYKDAQPEFARKWLLKCRDRGVAVLWLGLNKKPAPKLLNGTGAEFVSLNGDVLGAAREIGAACTRILTAASQ